MHILLADDHDLVRDAIGSLLKSSDDDIEMTVARDLPEALSCARATRFDVIILDLRMPGMNGLVGAQKMMDAAPDTHVMIMSGQASAGDVRAAHKIGIRGFVPKTLAGKSLISAVNLVASGETYFPAHYMNEQTSGAAGDIALTPREKDVLAQLRQGNSNKEIARALDIAETTVKLHIRSLSEKLSARNRTDIVIKAIDAGLA